MKSSHGMLLTHSAGSEEAQALLSSAKDRLIHGSGVYLYLLDEGVTILSESNEILNDLLQQGAVIYVCAYGALKRHLEPNDHDERLIFSGLVSLAELLSETDTFESSGLPYSDTREDPMRIVVITNASPLKTSGLCSHRSVEALRVTAGLSNAPQTTGRVEGSFRGDAIDLVKPEALEGIDGDLIPELIDTLIDAEQMTPLWTDRETDQFRHTPPQLIHRTADELSSQLQGARVIDLRV